MVRRGHAVQGGEGGGLAVHRDVVGGVVAGLLDENQGFRLALGGKAVLLLAHNDPAVEHKGIVVDGQEPQVAPGINGLGQIIRSAVLQGHAFGIAVQVADNDAARGEQGDIFFVFVPVDDMSRHARRRVAFGRGQLGQMAGGRAALEEVRHRGIAVDLFLGLGGQADAPGLLGHAGDEVGNGGGDQAAHQRDLRLRCSRVNQGFQVPVGGKVPLRMLGRSWRRSSASIRARARASSACWKS